jgi:hypothetical protein
MHQRTERNYLPIEKEKCNQMRYLIALVFLCFAGLASAQVKGQDHTPDVVFKPYAVRLYLVHKLPVPNPALLRWESTVVWHKYPTDWTEIDQLVTLPDFIRRRGYKICKDCPLEVVEIRPMR